MTDADNFTMSYPKDIDPRLKAAMAAALLLIDYQFFEDEEVHGDAGLRATLSFACNLTHSFLHVQWDARLAGADDIAACVASGLPENCVVSSGCSAAQHAAAWARFELTYPCPDDARGVWPAFLPVCGAAPFSPWVARALLHTLWTVSRVSRVRRRAHVARLPRHSGHGGRGRQAASRHGASPRVLGLAQIGRVIWPKHTVGPGGRRRNFDESGRLAPPGTLRPAPQ